MSLGARLALAQAAVFSAAKNAVPVVRLDGLWRFQLGDDARWAEPGFDDSEWALLRSDVPWGEQSWRGRSLRGVSGFAWYRFRVVVGQTGETALLLPSILTDYEVFANGRKVGGEGRMPPQGSLRFNQRRLYRLGVIEAGEPVEIAIRVWHHPVFATYLGGGPRYGGARLGDAAYLEQELDGLEAVRLKGIVSFFAIAVLNAVIGVTVFGLFLYRRSEREYLWFALLVGMSALQSVRVMVDFAVNFPLGLGDFLAEGIGAVGIVASLLFFTRVLEVKRGWVWRAVVVLAVLDPLNVGWYLLGWTSPATATSLRILFDLPIEAYIVVLLCGRAWAGNRNARLLLAPVMLLYGTAILGGALLMTFQMGWQSETLARLHAWNVVERPFPVSLEAFTQLVFSVALLAFLIRRFARSRAKEERLTSDVEAVRGVQQVLIPERSPEIADLEIRTAYHPAQEVGGDFFQIVPLGPGGAGGTLVVLGDVAGKGLPAAMTVAMLVGALRSLVETTWSPGEILAGLNRRLAGRGSGLTTCLAMRFGAGAVVVANAGHLAPYLNGREMETEPAFPLGVDGGAVFEERRVELKAGDRLTLVTDGVPEAQRRRELFGFERTAEMSGKSAGEIAEAALAFGQTDDITVISVVAR